MSFELQCVPIVRLVMRGAVGTTCSVESFTRSLERLGAADATHRVQARRILEDLRLHQLVSEYPPSSAYAIKVANEIATKAKVMEGRLSSFRGKPLICQRILARRTLVRCQHNVDPSTKRATACHTKRCTCARM
jgi:hypothetical protein